MAVAEWNGVSLADVCKVILNVRYGRGETEKSDALRRAEVLVSWMDLLAEIWMGELEKGSFLSDDLSFADTMGCLKSMTFALIVL